MSTDPLAGPRFQLDAFEKSIKLRNESAKAYAEYLHKLSEVALNLTKDKRNQHVVGRLEKMGARFDRLYQSKLSEQRNEKKRLTRVSKSATRALMLSQGEMANPDMVSHIWIGIRFILFQTGEQIPEISSTQVTDEHRSAEHWCYNRQQTSPKQDLRSGAIPALIVEAMRASLMPRSGSPPYNLLGGLLDALQTAAQKEVGELEGRLKQIDSEIKELDAADAERVLKLDEQTKE